MKKRFLSLMLVVSILFGLITFIPLATSADTYGIYTYGIANGEAIILDCDESASGTITIPSTIGGYPVTEIDKSAFAKCKSLTGINIPNSVTTIGAQAFSMCTNVAFITVPASVTSIRNAAFEGCSQLTAIYVDKSNQKYADINGVLFSKDKTTFIWYPAGKTSDHYRIPSSVTTVNSTSFLRGNLKSLTIPGSVVKMNSYAFGYSNIENAIIEHGVTSITNSAFRHSQKLKSIHIPSSVSSIGDYAFFDCDNLTDVYYAGSKNDWNRISIADGNDCLKNARMHYTKSANIPVTGITLNINDLTLKIGDIKQLQAICIPSNAADKTLTWSSNNSDVASVDNNGVIRANRLGYATIMAKSNNGKTAMCTVEVKSKNDIDFLSYEYSFMNGHDWFGYPDNYRIPVERYLQAGYSIPVASLLYIGKWGGNCFGM